MGLLKIEPNGQSIVLAMVNGNVYAMDSVCSHEGGPLEEGTLKDTILHVLGIMLFLISEVQQFQMQLFGLQSLPRIQ